MKDGSPRFCVNYWALNKRIKAGKFTLPDIENLIDNMAESRVFNKLDMFAGYWKFKQTESVRGKTTLRCKLRFFQIKVMPFGLMNALFSFQALPESLFQDLDFVDIYFDDFVIDSASSKEHINQSIISCDWITDTDPNVNLKNMPPSCGTR